MAGANSLKDIPLFSCLSERELDALSQFTTKKTYPKNNVIFFEEEEGDNLFVINSGRVKVSKYSSEGKEIILAILGRGDFFGDMSLVDGEPRSATVIAIEDTNVVSIRRRDFQTLMRSNPEIAFAMLAVLSHRLREANCKIGNLALLDVYGRLASILKDLAGSEGHRMENGWISFRRPTHQALASMIGTSRETVTRTLGDLHRRGFVKLAGKEIIIKERFERDLE